MKTIQLRCPHCREFAAIPGSARHAARIACQHCGTTSVLRCRSQAAPRESALGHSGANESSDYRPSASVSATTLDEPTTDPIDPTEVSPATPKPTAGPGPSHDDRWRQFADRGLQELQAVRRSCRQIGDVLVDLGFAATRRLHRNRQSRQALLQLGETCLKNEQGDAELRQSVLEMDERIESLQAAAASTRALQAERRGLLIRLAKSRLTTDECSSLTASVRKATAEETAAEQQLSEACTAFAAIRRRQWLHLAGCVAVLWMLGWCVQVAGCKSEDAAAPDGLDQYYANDAQPIASITAAGMSDTAAAIAEHLQLGNMEAAETLLDAHRFSIANEPALPVFEAWLMLSQVDIGGPANRDAIANPGDQEPAYQLALKKLRAAVQIDPQIKGLAADAVYASVVRRFNLIAAKGQAISANDNLAYVRKASEYREPQVEIPEELKDTLLFSCYSVELTRQQLGVQNYYQALEIQLMGAMQSSQGSGSMFSTGSWVELTGYANEIDPQAIHRWEARLRDAQQQFEKSDCYLSSLLVEAAILRDHGQRDATFCESALEFLLGRLEHAETTLAAERILVAFVCYGEYDAAYLAKLLKNDDARLAKLLKLFGEKADPAKLKSVRNYLKV